MHRLTLFFREKQRPSVNKGKLIKCQAGQCGAMERVHNFKTCQIIDESSQGDLSYFASF